MITKFNSIQIEENKLVLSQNKELKTEIFFNELNKASITIEKKTLYFKFLIYLIPLIVLANYFLNILSTEYNFIVIYVYLYFLFKLKNRRRFVLQVTLNNGLMYYKKISEDDKLENREIVTQIRVKLFNYKVEQISA